MFRLLLLIAFLAANTIAFACDKLVWSDEFDYEGKPNSAKWGFDTGGGGWGNNEEQFYTNRLENAFVKDGYLTIRAIKESYENRNYTSARLVTREKGDWKYGKFEIRAKLPGGRGTWPAIWMLPTDWEYGGWPSSGEIDIMEHVGYDMNNVHGTVHTNAYNHLKGTQKGGSKKLADVVNDFHVYAIEWTEKQIDFFIDGEKYFTFYKEDDDYKKWPFDKRFHLILNIAIGGNWGGVEGIDNDIFPVEMVVDYVRVYQSFDELEIKGPDVVNAYQQDVEFECTQIPGVEYEWTLPSDAKIIEGSGTYKIKVNWGNTDGDVKAKTVNDNDCSGLEGAQNVIISNAPDVEKFLIDDFEGNAFGAFAANENVDQSITTGKIQLKTAQAGEKLVYQFSEMINIENIPLLKVAFEGKGINEKIAAIALIDQDGNKTQLLNMEIEPRGQTQMIHMGADFSSADGEFNFKKVVALQINFLVANKTLSIDEMALYSTKSVPIAPQNPLLFSYGEKYILWWQDSPNALNYDVLFGPELDGEYYGLHSNLLGNEIPVEIAFTTVKKYYRIVAKNDAGVSERSMAITENSLGLQKPIPNDFLVKSSEQLIFRENCAATLYDLSGKKILEKQSANYLNTSGFKGVYVLRINYENYTFNQLINF